MVAIGPPAHAAAKPAARSNFAEFRRQMKMKNAAAAATADVTVPTSPGRQSPRSGMMHVILPLLVAFIHV